MKFVLNNSRQKIGLKLLEQALFFLADQKFNLKSFIHLLKQRESLELQNKAPRNFTLNAKPESIYLDKPNILYIKAQGAYSKVFFKNGEHSIISKNLKTLTNIINDTGFIRTHKSFLVNKSFVTQYLSNAKGYSLALENGSNIPISVRKKKEVEELLKLPFV